MTESINKTQLFELKDFLGDEYENLIQNFIHESTTDMRAIQTAFEYSDNAMGAIAIASLKGASTNLGATDLALFCHKLLLECKENRLQCSDVLLYALQEELQRVTLFLRQEVA